MEAAFALAAMVAVLLACLAGLSAVSMQVRCIDAAREAARLAARGDERDAIVAARRIAPAGAVVALHRDGGFVVVAVTAGTALLPGVAIRGDGIAAVEVGAAAR